MKTVMVAIGNSDDKLTQRQWAAYIAEIRTTLLLFTSRSHNDGLITECFTAPASYKQSAVFVVSIPADGVVPLQEAIAAVRASYDQDSAAVLVGETEFV